MLGQVAEVVRLALGLEAKVLTLGHLGAAEKAVAYLSEAVEAQAQTGIPSVDVVACVRRGQGLMPPAYSSFACDHCSQVRGQKGAC